MAGAAVLRTAIPIPTPKDQPFPTAKAREVGMYILVRDLRATREMAAHQLACPAIHRDVPIGSEQHSQVRGAVGPNSPELSQPGHQFRRLDLACQLLETLEVELALGNFDCRRIDVRGTVASAHGCSE